MMLTLNDICRRAEMERAREERKRKMTEAFKNTLATIGAVALLFVVWEVPHYLHRLDCNGHDCDWFWCDHYNGKGDI